jgi:hypothetical protein
MHDTIRLRSDRLIASDLAGLSPEDQAILERFNEDVRLRRFPTAGDTKSVFDHYRGVIAARHRLAMLRAAEKFQALRPPDLGAA